MEKNEKNSTQKVKKGLNKEKWNGAGFKLRTQ